MACRKDDKMKVNSVFKSNEGKEKILNFYNRKLDQWPIKYKERYIATDYGETYIIESGCDKSPPLVMIHGSSTNSSMWIGDVERLSKDYHIILIDILGEPGKSSENRHSLTNSDHADWIKQILEALNIENASFVGNSLGGWMILKFATCYPHLVNKIVLLATSGISPVRPSFSIKLIPFLLMGSRGLKHINQIVYGSTKFPDEVIEISNLIMSNFKPRVGSIPVFSDNELERLTMPLLFIGGEKDALLPTLKTAKRLNNVLPHAEVIVLKNRGHVIIDVLDDILNFLSSDIRENAM